MLGRSGRRNFITVLLLGSIVAGVTAVLVGGAGAASPCANSLATANALTTTSADGTTVHGSACSDRIVVTSPLVNEVVGGEGDDVIYANPNVEVVEGGAGDDVIYGDLPEAVENGTAGPVYVPAPGSASTARISIVEKKCEAGKSCYGGDGSQELIGSSGADKIFGQRGNDILKGNAGNDELFGGVGDESLISGGAGNDLLSGGLGTDTLNGNEDSDTVRGDGTIDTIEDTGSSGTDTLTFATGVTPGFHGEVPISGFPTDNDSEERGVKVLLDGSTCEGHQACNNEAIYGGGLDTIVVSGFENVVGSPFADYIVGSEGPNRINGGGGADVIYGGEGNDEIFGGADGDFIRGEGGTDTADGQSGSNNCTSPDVENRFNCLGVAEKVVQRDRSKIAVGFMVVEPASPLNWSELYATGSTGNDRVKAAWTSESVTFTTEGESAAFDTSGNSSSLGCSYEAAKVVCTLSKPVDVVTMAGMGGNDVLTLENFPETSTPVMLGGEGNDELFGGKSSEDMLVDGNGSGADLLKGFGYDDALINNEGKDKLEGGNGNDLLLSTVNCEGDTLDGAESGSGDGSSVNSASWAKYPVGETETGVVADLQAGTAGNAGGPSCTAGETEKLPSIDDLEASTGKDVLFGDGNGNNLLGRLGKDEIWGRAGADNIEAQDGTAETGGGGEGSDTCSLDASDKFSSCNP